MLSIDLVKEEYFRIKALMEEKYSQKIKSITRNEYEKNCMARFTPYQVKKQLKLTFNQLKEEIGEPFSTTHTVVYKEKTPQKKIYCRRGEGSMIFPKSCVPGCNDACNDCENPQEGNIKAAPMLTPEEDWEQCTVGIHGSSHGKTIEDTINFD